MDAVQFERGKQREYLRQIKTILGLPWKKVAHDLHMSKSSLYGYLREDRSLPIKVYDYFSTIHASNYSYRRTYIRGTARQIIIPPLSEDLAEFIGALAGDGHLRLKSPAEICIVTNRVTDREYLYYLSKVFSDLFKYNPTICFQNNTIRLKFYCKELVEKLSKAYDLPTGKKKNKLHIPQQILQNKCYLIPYLRGVFDTDGSFTRHHKSQKTYKESGGIVEICSLDRNFLLEINRALNSLGFTTSVGTKNVKIYSKQEIDWFFSLVQPSNTKHLYKYWFFKCYGEVPLTSEIVHSFIYGNKFYKSFQESYLHASVV